MKRPLAPGELPPSLPTDVTVGIKGQEIVVQSCGNDIVGPMFFVMTPDEALVMGRKLVEPAHTLGARG